MTELVRLQTGMAGFVKDPSPGGWLIRLGAVLRDPRALWRWKPNHEFTLIRRGPLTEVYHATLAKGVHFQSWDSFLDEHRGSDVRIVPLDVFGARSDYLEDALHYEGTPYEKLPGMARIPWNRNGGGTDNLFCSELGSLLRLRALARVAAQRAAGLCFEWMDKLEAEIGWAAGLAPSNTEPDEDWVRAKKVRPWLKPSQVTAR